MLQNVTVETACFPNAGSSRVHLSFLLAPSSLHLLIVFANWHSLCALLCISFIYMFARLVIGEEEEEEFQFLPNVSVL